MDIKPIKTESDYSAALAEIGEGHADIVEKLKRCQSRWGPLTAIWGQHPISQRASPPVHEVSALIAHELQACQHLVVSG